MAPEAPAAVHPARPASVCTVPPGAGRRDRIVRGFAIVAALGGGCTRVSDSERFEPNPQRLRIERTSPAAGEIEIPIDARIELCASGRLDPRAPSKTDALLGSGNITVDTDLSIELVPWHGPRGTPPGDVPWCEGSVIAVRPKSALAPGVRYRLIVQPTNVGWEGERFDTDQAGWVERDDGSLAYFLEFTTTTTPADPPDEPEPETPAITLTDLFSAGGPFDPARAQCSCHLDTDDVAHARLDLTDPAVAFVELVGEPRLRDTGFPMVSPRAPSESFLIHKLLRDDDDDDDPLRGVLGDAMPLGEPPLSYGDLRLVMQWIADGALP